MKEEIYAYSSRKWRVEFCLRLFINIFTTEKKKKKRLLKDSSAHSFIPGITDFNATCHQFIPCPTRHTGMEAHSYEFLETDEDTAGL